MYIKPIIVAIGLLAGTGAAAADSTSQTPSSADTAAKPLARRVLAPSVHVMRATRQADGTLALDCVQRPNPLLIKPGAPNSPRKNGGEP